MTSAPYSLYWFFSSWITSARGCCLGIFLQLTICVEIISLYHLASHALNVSLGFIVPMYVFARCASNLYLPSQISYGGGRHSKKMCASKFQPSACSQFGGGIPGHWRPSKRWKTHRKLQSHFILGQQSGSQSWWHTLFFSLPPCAWKFKHFAKCSTIRNGLLFCDDDLLFVLSFVSKNSYLLWVVLESFRKSREILQREEQVKERVSHNGSNGLFFVSINIFCIIETSIQSSVIPASVRCILASFFVLPLKFNDSLIDLSFSVFRIQSRVLHLQNLDLPFLITDFKRTIAAVSYCNWTCWCVFSTARSRKPQLQPLELWFFIWM